MDVCDRKTFSEILIGLVLFILASTPVLAGSAEDLKPRVPPERLKEAQSFQNPFTSSADIVAKGKKLYEAKPTVQRVTVWKGLEEQVGDVIRQMV